MRGGVPATHSTEPVQEPEPQPEPADDDSGELTEEEEQAICDRIAGKPVEKKKRIDAGKIGALFKAGWSVKAIADDVGTSDTTVYTYLKKMGLWKGKDE